MTEKNAVKSETVSPAREWLDAFEKSGKGCKWLTKAIYEQFAEDTLVGLLNAYASHVSSLSSQALGAAAKEAAEKYVTVEENSSNTFNVYFGERLFDERHEESDALEFAEFWRNEFRKFAAAIEKAAKK